MTIVVGLTGGIASGKSTVVGMLKQYFPIIDADQVAREVVQPPSPALRQIATTFGAKVIQTDGSLNRRLLGQIVFSNPRQLQQLNQIEAPLIRQRIITKINQWRQQRVALGILDMPLLFEQNYQPLCDVIVVVDITSHLQLQRLMKRNHFTKQEAQQRISSQWPLARKKAQADIIIDNNGTLAQLHQNVLSLVARLQNMIERRD